MSKTFVHSFPIKIKNIYEEHILDKKLDISRIFYNKMLEETFNRYNKIISSTEYLEAIKLYKTRKDKNIKQAYELFNKAKKDANFSEFDLHKYATKLKNETYFLSHLGADIPQKIATKVFKSVHDYLHRKKGKPRFKTKNSLNSIEGKSIKSELQFKNNKFRLSKYKTIKKKRKPVEFNLIFNENDVVETHALESKTKFVRLVKKFSAGKYRYYMQLILEGKPYQKYEVNEGKVGVDNIQRELLSAFLAIFVENDELDVQKAYEAFSGADSHLKETASTAILAAKSSKLRHLSYALQQ